MKIHFRRKKHRDNVKYAKRLTALLKHPMFWFLTVTGNAMIILGSVLLYVLESSSGEMPIQFIDCLLWSTSIITTIGYVSFLPQTFMGKVTVIALMLVGTFFLWTYMAFLVSALVSPALSSLEKEMLEVEKEISDLKNDDHKTKT